jgi:hypothetical protein
MRHFLALPNLSNNHDLKCDSPDKRRKTKKEKYE